MTGAHSMRWLMIEGLLPLIGAGLLYALWGVARYISTKEKSKFSFVWMEALDPFGWLYGGGIIAVQSLVKNVGISGWSPISVFLLIEAIVCTFLLIAAMNERGQDATWKPTTSLTAIAAILVAAILYEGFLVYHSV